MNHEAKLERLQARHVLVTTLTLAAFGLCLLSLVGVMAHVETGDGPQMRDVHIPGNWYLGLDRTLFSAGEPYDVGLGLKKIPQWINFIAFTGGQLAGMGMVVWALAKNRKLAVPALVATGILGFCAPVPKVMMFGTSKAVSPETAERLLAGRAQTRTFFQLSQPHETAARYYVQAQIAFVRGDRPLAKSLSEGLDRDKLSSPIEAPYRLQYLHGRYDELTTVCFATSGCLREPQRDARWRFFLWAAIVLAMLGCAIASLSIFMRDRLTRIDALMQRHSASRVLGAVAER